MHKYMNSVEHFVRFGKFYKYIYASEACFHDIVASSDRAPSASNASS